MMQTKENQTRQQDFTKILRVGTSPSGDVFIKIEFADGKLSITGVEGPMRNGNASGSCGQINMSEWDISEYAPGFDRDVELKLREIWDQWHLNEMQAGSPAQMAFLKANPITDRLNHYTKACQALAAAGLNPDPNYLHNHKPYRYGSAWLSVEVPEDVLVWLQALPDTDKTPAWC